MLTIVSVICSLLSLFATAGEVKREIAVGFTGSENQFRVLSYNIRYRADADEQSGNGWELRKGPLAKLILSNQSDLVGTQEGDQNQLRDLKALLPGFDYLSHPYGSSRVEGNCGIFYKSALFQVLDSGVFWLSETPETPSVGWDADDKRICFWAKLKSKQTGKAFYFFNTHFYWRFKTAREASGPLMARKIKEIAGRDPVICTGDFNSTAETPQIIAMKKILSDAYDVSRKPREGVDGTNLSGGVFSGAPVNRIDYIFLSRHFKVEDYKVLSATYADNRYPSDHLPVTALLSF